MNKIQLNKINKCFGDKFCLKDINLEVNGGEIFAFIGANGSGKTTTIRIILGLMEHDSGSVNISNGEEYFSPKKLGLVLEDEKPFEGLTPLEYLDFFTTYYSVNPKEKKEKIINILKKFSLYEWKNKRIKHFSKGMKRQLTIAKAILHEPDIIIMDEPFEGISPEIRKIIKDILREFVNNQKIVFLSTHNLDEAENFCSSFGIMKNGKFLGKWHTNDINTSLEEFYFNKTKELL